MPFKYAVSCTSSPFHKFALLTTGFLANRYLSLKMKHLKIMMESIDREVFVRNCETNVLERGKICYS